MGYNNKLKRCALILTAAGSLSAVSVQAATAIMADNIKEFTKDNSTQSLTVRMDSWYNSTMGYRGWSHHSGWGWMKLKKGKPVTITVGAIKEGKDGNPEAGYVEGFHPGITVWYRPMKRGSALIEQVNAHKYSQFDDIDEPNAINDDVKTAPVSVGKIHMEFIANAFDRDGMGDSLPEAYDQSKVNRALDGEKGKVRLTFTPKYSGVYQFVVGGINPDEGVNAIDFNAIPVTVSFSE